MRTLSQHTEPHLFFKTLHFKRMRVILMSILLVFVNESSICVIEDDLTLLVGKIKLFEVLDKDVLSNVLNSRHITTLVNRLGGIVVLGHSIGDHFLTTSSLFSLPGPVVVAFNPKSEIAPSFDHFVIGLFVVVELFEVCNIAPYLATSNRTKQVDEIWHSNHNDTADNQVGELKQNNTHDDPTYHQNSDDKDRHVCFRILLERHISLGDFRIKPIEEELPKPLGNALVDLLFINRSDLMAWTTNHALSSGRIEIIC